ncbi:MAG TPA: tRNA (guanosine(46)-N7)-methyltransferase TrmB [Chlamydiales bacterium]|nr:tRNA (guanosine(46)-N7)-methyltransferase TrmB [Chlamydiales bacterium]
MKTAKDLIIPFTWQERRPIFLDRFFYIPGHYECRPETIPFFETPQPIIVEYCSGNGQWIGDRARQNPQFNWIAVEKQFERARKIWLKSHRESIPNLSIVCGDALTFTRYFAPLVSEVYVNFPDPWPKRRHAKHRLIQAEFLQAVAKIVQPGGQAICVTDHPAYATEMAQEFAKCPEWTFLFNVNEWPDYGRSFFNDLWIGQGRTINYLSHERKTV